METAGIFSHSVACVFASYNGQSKIFNFDGVHLMSFSFYELCFWCQIQEFFP